MAFPVSPYAPPAPYTQTLFESPLAGAIQLLTVPVFIGEGSEILSQQNLEVVRGSSASVDQQVPLEDETGRAVVSISTTGQVTLGDWDGDLSSFQVRNFPIVNGDGSGTTTTDRSSVLATINGEPTVVMSVDGANGIVRLADTPKVGDLVRCTYFFNRTDTLGTDDVSDQVTDEDAVIYGALGKNDADLGGTETFDIVSGVNDEFKVTVDNGTEQTLTLSAGSFTAKQIADTITNAGYGTLVGSVYLNNFGKNAILLTADQGITIGDGSANAPLGFVTDDATSRRTTFYTFNGPIVDGTNGGITTTDPANVTVKVDNVQVIPTAVDGANRAVTLPVAPAAGSTVAITYYWNTWQDTFDYLANIGVQSVTRCGITADRNDYIDGADFILKDDLIVWGTATLTSSGTTTTGSDLFGESQITTTLVDNKTYLSACSPVTNTSVVPAVTSTTVWQLPFQPTTGNGRNSPLGASLFQTVSNGRIDLPTTRPDLVTAYWGYSLSDALARGAVEVIAVDSATSQITLKDGVPVGAGVWATFYYNLLTDNEFTLTCVNPGVSGVGTYSVTDTGGNSLYNATYNVGDKGSGLTGVTIEFPSGSEYTPDLRFEAQSGTDYDGPVEEVVTVTFATAWAAPARFTTPGFDPYSIIEDASDKMYVRIDNSDLTTAVGIDLSDPSGNGWGFYGTVLGDEVVYDESTGAASWTLTTSENQLSITTDDINIEASVDPNVAGKTIDDFVGRLNEASHGVNGIAQGAGVASQITLAATASAIDDYYVGWNVMLLVDNSGAGFTVGQTQTITAYDGATKVATISGTWAPGPATDPAATDTYWIYNPDTLPVYKGQAQFKAPFEIEAAANNKYDQFTIAYKGSVTGVIRETFTLTPGTTYATASALATEIQTQLDAGAIFNLASGVSSPYVSCTATADGEMQFEFTRAGQDADGGYFCFELSGAGPVYDHEFAFVAGIDVAPNAGIDNDSAHIMHAAVAYKASISAVAPVLNDRIVLRSRLIPGSDGEMNPNSAILQTGLAVNAGVGNSKAGLSTEMYGAASNNAAVKPATLFGRTGLGSGQHDGSIGVGTRGEPAVVFYDGTGTTAANNVWDLTVDGVAIQVVFTASATGTNTPLGSAVLQNGVYDAGSVIGQIQAAIAALPDTPFGVLATVQGNRMVEREGLGFRITSQTTESSSRIEMGSGSANSTLGFTDGDVALRVEVQAAQVAGSLMNNAVAAASGNLVFGDGGSNYGDHGPANPAAVAPNRYFAGFAVAGLEVDDAGAEYVFFQSLTRGASSSVEFRNATSDDILRWGTGLLIEAGDGAVGEDAVEGYYVTSSKTDGSGSANDSVLNSGTGQDGFIGQTYRDKVTGLTFTILPRQGNISYPTGGTAYLRFQVSKTFVTDANIPVTTLPGLEMYVANTVNVAAGDTAVVETFERGGEQPTVGDIYYVSYTYTKQDYSTALFTKISAVEAAYGEVSPDNPLSMAAYLAVLNGALIVGLKQVPRATNEPRASLQSYRDAIDDLEGALPGQIYPDIITPLRGDSQDLFLYLSRSNDIQSSIRYKAERTSIIGIAAGNNVEDVGSMAQVIGSTRMRLCYPDTLLIPITDALGTTREYLVEGEYLASMMVGNRVSPNLDPASPWTNALLVGSNGFGRKLDAVEQNQAAVQGVTVFEHRPPFLRCRHGLTTDMTNILTKTPTIIQIADYVQRTSRATLETFIGVKFLPGILSQVEGRLAEMFKAMVRAQIVAAYTGIKANPQLDNPTAADVEAYYSPVWPLLYLILTFHLRSQLSA